MGTACGRLLNAGADRAVGFARCSRNLGHDHIRDWWTSCAQQVVNLSRSNGSRCTSRARNCERTCSHPLRLEKARCITAVVVAHSFTIGTRPDVPDGYAAFGPAAHDKFTEYNSHSENEYTIVQVNKRPSAFGTFGRWGQDAAVQLRAAARRRRHRPDVQRCVSLAGFHARVLHRWRAERPVAPQRRSNDVWPLPRTWHAGSGSASPAQLAAVQGGGLGA